MKTIIRNINYHFSRFCESATSLLGGYGTVQYINLFLRFVCHHHSTPKQGKSNV